MKNFTKLIFSFTFSLMIITGAVYLTVAFKPLYYFDIGHLNISESTGISKEEIRLNYDYMIDYNMSSDVGEFELPTIKSSVEGAIHFEEVRDIFQVVKNLFYISSVLSLIGGYFYIRNREFDVFRRVLIILIVMPLVVAIPLIIDFNKSFILFHEVMFSNDYWIFDPKLDPVIRILPEEFFFHSGICILGIILVSSMGLYKLSKKSM